MCIKLVLIKEQQQEQQWLSGFSTTLTVNNSVMSCLQVLSISHDHIKVIPMLPSLRNLNLYKNCYKLQNMTFDWTSCELYTHEIFFVNIFHTSGISCFHRSYLTRNKSNKWKWSPHTDQISPLKPELNPICYLLALLGAHIFSTLAG